MESDEGLLDADVRDTIQSLRRGSVLSAEAEAKYQGFLSSSQGKLTFQGGLLLAAVSAYTFGPLLVSWSTLVRVPDSARFVTVEPPLRHVATPHDWFGITLGYQPGNAVLFVTKVDNASLASVAYGVLPGDVLSRAWQDDRDIWPPTSRDDIMKSRELSELGWFVQTTPTFGERYNLSTIDVNRPVYVNFEMTHVEVSKSRSPYFPMSTTFVKCLLGSIILSAISAAQNQHNLKMIFNLQTARIMMLPSLGWALVEICEVVATSSMNPALYSVLCQTRMLAMLLCMRLLFGTKQTTLQFLILVTVSMVIYSYVQIPDYFSDGKFWNGFGDPQDVVVDGTEATREVQSSSVNFGMVFAFLKICLSVVMSFVGQKAMEDPHIKNMSLITMQASMFVLSTIPVLILTWFAMGMTGWSHGFFGGATVQFRHCLKDSQSCGETVPVAQVVQGWDKRTLLVALFYCYRDVVVNGVLKSFDALMRTMVSGSATLFTYWISLGLLGTKFNSTKVVLICGIMMQFVEYAIAPKYVESPPVQTFSNNVELNEARI